MPHALESFSVVTPTVGTGTLDLGTPIEGYLAASAAGAVDGGHYEYLIESADKAEWERAIGTFLAGNPEQLTRDIVRASSNGGERISLQAGVAYTVSGVIAASAVNRATVAVAATGSIGLARRGMTEAVDAGASAIARTLPAAAAAMAGFEITLIKVDAGEHAVTVQRAGTDTIAGETAWTLPGRWDAVTLRSDGVAGWHPVAGGPIGAAARRSVGGTEGDLAALGPGGRFPLDRLPDPLNRGLGLGFATLPIVAGAVTPDMAEGDVVNFTVTLDQNVTLEPVAARMIGASGLIEVVQDATGGRTMSFDAEYAFPGGAVPALSAAAGAIDTLAYLVRASDRVLLWPSRGLD